MKPSITWVTPSTGRASALRFGPYLPIRAPGLFWSWEPCGPSTNAPTGHCPSVGSQTPMPRCGHCWRDELRRCPRPSTRPHRMLPGHWQRLGTRYWRRHWSVQKGGVSRRIWPVHPSFYTVTAQPAHRPARSFTPRWTPVDSASASTSRWRSSPTPAPTTSAIASTMS